MSVRATGKKTRDEANEAPDRASEATDVDFYLY